MSLKETGAALEAYPPRWEFGAQRAQIMASLDRQITVQIRKGWDEAERAKLKPLHEFYLRRVDIGLDKLERARVSAGVHAFKFYSSSFILKTARGTVAVDFCQGPVNNGGEPEVRDEYRSGFYWTPAQRDRLARLVDAVVITHRHHDHADYSLASRLARQGKTVIGPEQLKQIWKGFAGAITVPSYGNVQSFGQLEIFTKLGMQYSRNEPSGNGTERNGIPASDAPGQDSETVLYLFKLAGITFLACGENHVPAGDWLRNGLARGFRPDVLMSLGQFQGERSVIAELKPLRPIFTLPRHEYEFMHEGGGNRTGPLMQGSNRAAFDRREMMPLLWGEDFLITPEVVACGRRT
jgi:L-ascorbate metabolism protein UlaG (beta-lactamase superfamily)